MRAIGGLVAIALCLGLGSVAHAQDPISYDPNFYDDLAFTNPANPASPYQLRMRQLRLQQQQAGVLTKMKNYASGVTTSVTTGMVSGVTKTVAFLAAVRDPNNAIPNVTSGPGSPLQQPGSLSGTAAQAQNPTPTAAPLFPTTAGKNPNLFPSLFGPPTAASSGMGTSK